ncbi:MAG: flagellar export chaperone FlgN [Deltaproteobacteria bacterium]|nr:flagellar export chaperone FlgN [Deltaproteobacteria bacterium]
MDENIIQLLEKLFFTKIMLYHDLLDFFNKEKESLINVDLDNLWNISKEKEEICLKIQSIQQEIISTVNPGMEQQPFSLNQILNMIPGDRRALFQKEYLALMKLKNEIKALRKENIILIDDSLQFLDEMISVITGECKSSIMYNDKCHLSQPGTNLLLSREA